MTKTAILYARVSTAEQTKGYSLAGQLDELYEYVKEQGYDVLEAVQDPGFSRDELDRPGMNRVRELVAAGDVDAVIA
jgi:site-specific DNA recombinase